MTTYSTLQLSESAGSLAALPSDAGQSLERLLHGARIPIRSKHASRSIEGETLARNASTPQTLARLQAFLTKSGRT